ncbi:hypothetical protein LJC68_06950 [Bacteroidales bacterium OttesenSCG-928-B11]|nr:hypothetical protein [Bacteroidales bacterium OttesenSCG-928-E04]MDL2312598.1 hypothetical protein [Bacteroidales bacterium OttesenSCG-928-B11]
MKRTILVLVTLMMGIMSYAQITFENFNQEKVQSVSKVYPIGEENFMIINNEEYVVINPSMKTVSKTTFNFEKKTVFVSAYNSSDGGIIAIFRVYQKKDELYTYTKVVISPDGKLTNTEVLSSMAEERKERNVARSITSPDGNLHAHFLFTMDKNNILKELVILIMDNEGEIVSTRNVNPTFNNETFSFHKAYITNEGELYFAFSSTQKSKKRKDLQNISLHVLRVNEDGGEMFNLDDIEFGFIESMSMLMLENGDMFFGGFYSADPKKRIPGRFSVVFNKEQGEFQNMSTALLSGYEKHSPYDIYVLGMYEMENTVIMLGEEKRLITRRDNKGNVTYEYYAKNVLVCPFQKDGEMLKENAITKLNKSNNHAIFLYSSALKSGNNLYVLSNCNYKNEKSGKGHKTVNTGGTHAKIGIRVNVIAEDGSIERKTVEAPNVEKYGFSHIIYSDENQAFLLFGKAQLFKYEFKVRKVTLAKD